MDGRPIKPGYIVESVMLGNGEEEVITSKKQLVVLLTENANDTGRVLKCKIAYKDEIEVEIPAGSNLGFKISTRKGVPSITNIAPSCSLKSVMSASMVVNKVILEDYEMIGCDTDTINVILEDTAGLSGRKLVLLKPGSELSERTINFESKTLELPSGMIGIKLGAGVASIEEVAPESPLFGQIYPGMAIQALRVPNGTQYDDLSGLVLQKVLMETSSIEGRVVNLINAEDVAQQLEPTIKVFPAALGGSMNELNFSMTINEGNELMVGDVPDHSDLYGVLHSGLALSEFTWKDMGKPEQTSTPSSPQEMDELLSKSSGCDRYFVFRGLSNAFMPTEPVVIELEEGKIGATFKGKPARIVKIRDNSQLIGTAAIPGMVVAEAVVNGEVMIQPETIDLTKSLSAAASSPDRVLTLVNPNTLKGPSIY